MWDSVRCKAMRWTLLPLLGTGAAGTITMYVDYKGEDTVSTAVLASQMQGAITSFAYAKSIMNWSKQDGMDDIFVQAVQSLTNTNSRTNGSFRSGNVGNDAAVKCCILGYGLPVSAIFAQLWVDAVFEYTGMEAQ